MPKFNVEIDPVFDALATSLKELIKAAKAACPNKMEQLVGHVLTELGVTMKQQNVISYMMNGDVDPDELLSIIIAKISSSKADKEKKKYKISKEKLRTFFQTLIKENLIQANRTWQFISYWLEKNCEEWSGNKASQFNRINAVLKGVRELPKRAFATHNPKELDKVMKDPGGKMGKLYYDAIKRLEQLCIEGDENKIPA